MKDIERRICVKGLRGLNELSYASVQTILMLPSIAKRLKTLSA